MNNQKECICHVTKINNKIKVEWEIVSQLRAVFFFSIMWFREFDDFFQFIAKLVEFSLKTPKNPKFLFVAR
jgi:hypothetical protein